MAKIALTLIVVFFATLLPVWASLGPIMLGDHIVYIQNWRIEKPIFLSIDKFGLRQGYYRLRFLDKEQLYELPVYPDKLSNWRNDFSFFCDWKSQNILSKIASSKNRGPIRVSFTAWGTDCVTIKKIDLLEGLPDDLDVPPYQDGWQYLTSRNTPLPSNNDLYFDKTSLIIILICYVWLLPTNIFLWIARNSVKPYLRSK